MEQTASSKSVLNVIFRALRRRPLPIPPSLRPRRRRILWSLIKKTTTATETRTKCNIRSSEQNNSETRAF